MICALGSHQTILVNRYREFYYVTYFLFQSEAKNCSNLIIPLTATEEHYTQTLVKAEL